MYRKTSFAQTLKAVASRWNSSSLSKFVSHNLGQRDPVDSSERKLDGKDGKDSINPNVEDSVKAFSVNRRNRKELREFGAKLDLIGNSNLPYAKGVGLVERRRQHDGNIITTLYPKTIRRKTRLKLDRKRMLPDMDISERDLPISRDIVKGMKSVSEECVAGGEYYFEDGLRMVTPYYLMLDMQLKTEQMPPVTLLELMKKTFPFQAMDWFRFKASRGLILLNLKRCRPETLVRRGDYLTNLIHMHEHPALDLPIKVIYEDKDLFVVNKPPSYVSSPMSGYRMNSLKYLLKVEFGQDDLRPLHRLDKLTSGVCMFAKSTFAASRYKLMDADVSKEYLALVDGEFPPGEVICNHPLDHFVINNLNLKRYYTGGSKESCTIFRRVETDGATSLVSCKPITGRTHQIRQHLLALGFHIVNDAVYNPRDKRILMHDQHKEALEEALERLRNRAARADELGHSRAHTATFSSKEEWLNNLSSTLGHSPECIVCEMGAEVFKQLSRERDSLFMCLHAWKYKFKGREFVAELPPWVQDRTMLNSVFERRGQYSK